MLSRRYQIACWIASLLYAISAALQLNDPDPVRWMALYMGAAVCAAGLLRDRRWWMPSLAVTSIAAAWAGSLVPIIWGKVTLADAFLKMSEKGGAVEIEREIGGLALVVLGLGALAVIRATARPAAAPPAM